MHLDNARKTSYGLKSNVACTYSYYLGIGSQTLCGTFPHSCRENFCCPYFRSWRMGGGELTLGAGVHRAICIFTWTARRNFVHRSTDTLNACLVMLDK